MQNKHHVKLATLWLMYQGLKVNEKNILRTLKTPVESLEYILTQRRVQY